jgi:hypothetical protein
MSYKRATWGDFPDTGISDGIWQAVHATLDVAGLVIDAADLVNAGLYASRGQWANAAISSAAMIPVVGSIGTAGRRAVKAAGMVDEVIDAYSFTSKAIRRSDQVFDVYRAGNIAVDMSADIAVDLRTGQRLANNYVPVKTVTQSHHPLPKFLGGDAKQVLSCVDPALHGEFHGAIRVNLKDAGIPLNVGGRGGSTFDWANYMKLNPGTQRQAFDAVLDASRYMDVKYGTSMTQDVWRNIMNGSFTPHP